MRTTSLKVSNAQSTWLWHRCFPVNFVKILRTSFYTEHLWWLFLKVDIGKKKIEQFLFLLLSTWKYTIFRQRIDWTLPFTEVMLDDFKLLKYEDLRG